MQKNDIVNEISSNSYVYDDILNIELPCPFSHII